MNQDLNQDNYNTQGKNGMPNNQSLNNRNLNQGIGVNQQVIDAQQQPTIHESIPQSITNIPFSNTKHQILNGILKLDISSTKKLFNSALFSWIFLLYFFKSDLNIHKSIK